MSTSPEDSLGGSETIQGRGTAILALPVILAETPEIELNSEIPQAVSGGEPSQLNPTQIINTQYIEKIRNCYIKPVNFERVTM